MPTGGYIAKQAATSLAVYSDEQTTYAMDRPELACGSEGTSDHVHGVSG